MDIEGAPHRVRRLDGFGSADPNCVAVAPGGRGWRGLRLILAACWAPLAISYFYSLAPAAILFWISMLYFRGPMREVQRPSDAIWVIFHALLSTGVVIGAFRIRRVIWTVKGTERKYRTAVEHAADGILITDKDGLLLEANTAACLLLGRSRSDLLTHSLKDLASALGDDSLLDAFREILAGETFRHVSMLRRRDGRALAVESSGNLLGDGRVMMILRDVSAKKRVEDALRESEERHRVLAETANDAIITLNMSGEILFANRAADAVFGYVRNGLIGRNLTALVPERLRSRYSAAFDRYRRAGAGQPGLRGFEVEGRHKSGKIIPLEISVAECVLKGERLLTAFVRDITQHKQAREALQASERRYRLLFERNLAGVYRLTADGRLLECNESFARLLGAGSPEEILAQNATAFFPAPDDFTRFLARLRSERALTNVEICRRRIDGSPVWVLENVSLTAGGGGIPEMIQGTVMDISHRRQAEERVKASLAEKEVLLKEVHHRVKNNLQIISSLLALQSKRLQNPELQEPFRETENRVRSIALLHEEFYRSGNLAKIDFARYLQAIAGHLASAYDLPAFRVRLAVQAKPLTLDLSTAVPCALIVSELISNSLKHAFPGGRQGGVYVHLDSSSDGDVTLVVGDTGVGLPPGKSPHDNRTLGFHLVTTLVRQLRGTLEQRGGEGTEFRITFRSDHLRQS